MSDIVDRLKKRLAEEAVGCVNAPIIGYTGDGRLFLEAIAEIEQLLAELEYRTKQHAAEMASGDEQFEGKEAEIERLRAALQFYADRTTYNSPTWSGLDDPIDSDCGNIARAALGEHNE